MYMSRIALDVHRRLTMQAMSEPQLLHGAVESAFEGERERHLWRIDWVHDNCWLLLISSKKPELSHMAQQFGFPSNDSLCESKDYTTFLNRISAGQQWQFRLRANPVHSSLSNRTNKEERGKIFAHVTQEQQMNWLLKQAEVHGFSLSNDSFNIIHSNWVQFRKKENRQVTLHTVTFEGILEVKDKDKLKNALTCGIGRAKAYGCGLLTLMRPYERQL